MTRALRMSVVLLLALVLVAGCGEHPQCRAPSRALRGRTTRSRPTRRHLADAQPIDESCPTSNDDLVRENEIPAPRRPGVRPRSTATSTALPGGHLQEGRQRADHGVHQGGLAALFIKREVRLASQDVKANPTLCKAIAAPLARSATASSRRFDKLKSGTPAG